MALVDGIRPVDGAFVIIAWVAFKLLVEYLHGENTSPLISRSGCRSDDLVIFASRSCILSREEEERL